MGRTGKWWAIEHFGVEPDILLSGKGIASGMPLGAFIAREDLMGWESGAHGSTYGGNPVACAAALATIRLIDDGLMANAVEMGRAFTDGLKAIAGRHPVIRDVRGLGLMIGVQFPDHEHMAEIEQAAFRKGLLVLGCGDDVIRISPPLVITPDQVDTALEIFDETVAEVSGSGA
jgi:4-aminobutyrate aminotransferase